MGIRFGPLPPSFNNTYSLAFDGVDDYVSVPNLSISGASPRTMTCWFKTTSSVNQNIHENLIQEFHIEAAIPKSNWRVETLNNFYGQEESFPAIRISGF